MPCGLVRHALCGLTGSGVECRLHAHLPATVRSAVVDLHLSARRRGVARGGADRPGVRAGAARRGADRGARPQAQVDARDARARRPRHRRVAAAGRSSAARSRISAASGAEGADRYLQAARQDRLRQAASRGARHARPHRRLHDLRARRPRRWRSPATRCSSAAAAAPTSRRAIARTLFRSVREQIFSLPDDCLLYPGARLPRPHRHQRRRGEALQPAPRRGDRRAATSSAT